MTMYEVITVFKGIVYPKNLTLSSLLTLVPKLYFFLLLNTNKDILKNDSDQVPFLSIGPTTICLPTFFKISSFVFQKEMRAGLE